LAEYIVIFPADAGLPPLYLVFRKTPRDEYFDETTRHCRSGTLIEYQEQCENIQLENNGELLGSGLYGDVRIDNNDDRFVLKKFKPGSEYLADEECDLFNKVYGENSAEVINESGSTYLRMYKVPGKPLCECTPLELPSNAEELFFKMILDLNDLGIMHGDIHLGNIMYDRDLNKFWPIDLSNTYDFYYDGPSGLRDCLSQVDKERFDLIMEFIHKNTLTGVGT
ncbi:hypothetical protein, partial [uncultured Vibrio sp.]|uniref:OspG family effector kinase n=1 Tax=uncultured Vibrio sp. TaxID=114054 RepID=UPI00260CCC78